MVICLNVLNGNMPEYPGGKITHHRVYKHIIYAMYVHDF